MAQVQFDTVQALAYDEHGELIHPQLLKRYEHRLPQASDTPKVPKSIRRFCMPTSTLFFRLSPRAGGTHSPPPRRQDR